MISPVFQMHGTKASAASADSGECSKYTSKLPARAGQFSEGGSLGCSRIQQPVRVLGAGGMFVEF